MAVQPSQNPIGAAIPYCPQATLPLVSFHGDSDSQLNRKELRHQNHIKPQLEHPPLPSTGGGRSGHNNRTAGGARDTHHSYTAVNNDTQYFLISTGTALLTQK